MSDKMLEAALKSDAYGPYVEPGPNPGAGQPFVRTPNSERALERNVVVGPLLVSSCRCPQCGELYAHFAPFRGGYGAAMRDDEPDPPCWRCEVSVGVPLDPDEAAAMAEFRFRYDSYLAAIDIGSGKSQADMKRLFVVGCDAGMKYAPILLAALERRYGNQQDAGVAAILSGVSGVTEE